MNNIAGGVGFIRCATVLCCALIAPSASARLVFVPTTAAATGFSPYALTAGDVDQATLTRSATLDANDIVVTVKDGDVTLSGTVDSWADRASAVYLARGTSGVHHVADNIPVAY